MVKALINVIDLTKLDLKMSSLSETTALRQQFTFYISVVKLHVLQIKVISIWSYFIVIKVCSYKRGGA